MEKFGLQADGHDALTHKQQPRYWWLRVPMAADGGNCAPPTLPPTAQATGGWEGLAYINPSGRVPFSSQFILVPYSSHRFISSSHFSNKCFTKMASSVLSNVEEEQPISRTYQYRKVCFSKLFFVFSFILFCHLIWRLNVFFFLI